MDVLIPLAIVLLLVLANGLFVAAEFAIVGAPRASIEHLAAQGSALAQRVERILRASASARIATSPRRRSASRSPAWGSACMASTLWRPGLRRSLHAFEELRWVAAHSAGQRHRHRRAHLPAHRRRRDGAEGAGAAASRQNRALRVADDRGARPGDLSSRGRRSTRIGNALLRLFGVRRREVDTERYHTSEELQFIIQESQEGGLLRGESGRILRELFEFGDLTAREVMVPRVQLVGIPVGTDVAELRTSSARICTRDTRSIAATSITFSAASTSSGCCGHFVTEATDRGRRRATASVRAADDAARRSDCGDAHQPGADGGRDGRARRHRRSDHVRGSLRGGRRRHRRRPQPSAHHAARAPAMSSSAAPSASKTRLRRSVCTSSIPTW